MPRRPTISAALAASDVVEVMVNADGMIWIERIGQGRVSSKSCISPADAERVLRLLLAELPTKTAVKLAADITGGNRNQLYDLALQLKRADQDGDEAA